MKQAEKETKEIATIQPQQGSQLAAIDMNGANVPDLDDAQEFPVDLMDSYWEPVAGESKRVYFLEIKTRQGSPAFAKEGSDNSIQCAMFLEKSKGTAKVWANGSKRLVGMLQREIESGLIRKGTPLVITALGQQKNKSNSFFSWNWSVKPLLIQA